MQRMLFYAIVLFVLCFRFHKWLTAIGLAVISTASTAIRSARGPVLSSIVEPCSS
jgi:hypothetical protein